MGKYSQECFSPADNMIKKEKKNCGIKKMKNKWKGIIISLRDLEEQSRENEEIKSNNHNNNNKKKHHIIYYINLKYNFK